MNIKMNIIGVIGVMTFAVASAQGLSIRSKISSPTLYNAMDLSARDSYLSIAPFLGKSFNPVHMAEAFTMNGKAYFSLNEQGATAESPTVLADMNPIIIGLTTLGVGSGNTGDYKSTVELKPELKHYGALLHFYKKYNKFFGDVRSAVVSTHTQVNIIETGGGNGAFGSMKTFEDAVSNKDRKYGKMGSLQKKKGLENIQIMLGVINRFDDDAATHAPSNNMLTGYVLAEIPTGKGTTAEWVFEPRVGNNHGALGAGFEEYYVNDTATIVVGVAWRKFFDAKEKRSFDLKGKPWSRYIRVLSLPAPGTASFGIDYLTLDATVNPGQQMDAYLRWVKKWNNVQGELSYNFFYHQKETLSNVADFASSFGIYDAYSSSNTITASSATINTYNPVEDTAANVAIEKDDLDLDSAAVGTQAVSSVATRLEYCKDSMRLGIGGSVETAHSKAAYAAWNCWMNVAVLF